MNSNHEVPIKEDDLPWWDKPPVEDDEDDYKEEIVSKTIYLDRYDSLDSHVEECLRSGNLKMKRSRGKNKYVITGTEDAIEWFVKRLQQTSDTYIV